MSFKQTSLIIPARNEEESLPLLFEAIENLYPDINIIISDDGSTDKTQKIVKRKNKKNKNIILFDNSKNNIRGLCSAVVHAASQTTTKNIIVMDADLQHPPEKIKDIIKALDKGFDIVIGKRKKIKDWGKFRKIMSWGATSLGKLSLLLQRKKIPCDLLSGFFGIKTSLFQNIVKKNKKRFELRGYKILFDLLKSAPLKIKIAEVDYTFRGRQYGQSKIKSKHVFYFLKSLVK